MLTEKQVEQFCFDVLGDFINPKEDIMIQEVRGNFRVMITRTRGFHKEVLREEWNRNVEGTEFENVALYI